jgi:hypothetical protein
VKVKDDPKAGLVGILKLKLGACLSGPTKRMAADLHEAALSCRRVRNFGARWWQRWREDHPDHEGGLLPNDAARERYAAACALAPSLATPCVASCLREVDDSLKTRVPRGHPGEARYRWQAVLGAECNLETWRAEVIPLHNRTVKLCYAGDRERSEAELSALAHGKAPRLHRLTRTLAACGGSSCVLQFQLFSRGSGRAETNVTCRLEARQLTRGNRAVLRRIASGEWAARDSELVWHERDRHPAWHLHLVYRQPRPEAGLDLGRTATLTACAHDAERPFAVEGPEGRPWDLGFRGLAREYERMRLRRLALRNRYRESGPGRKGHGRGRVEAAIGPASRGLQSLAQRSLCLVVAEVLRYCRRQDCGRLVYLEPGTGARPYGWFGRKDIPFDWTNFKGRLAHKCALIGIVLEVGKARRAPPQQAQAPT